MKKFYLFFMIIIAFTGFSMAQTIENFESLKMHLFSAGKNGSLTVVPNPDTTGINKSRTVVKMVRGKDGDPWAGWYATLPTPLNVTTNPYLHIKVWKSRISPVAFKYEKVGGMSGDVFSMNPQTKVNQWEELVFNFSTVSAASGEYVKIVFLPDFQNPLILTEDLTLYFDDIYVNNNAAVGSAPVQVLENFEHIPLNLMLNGAADLSKMTIVPNPDSTTLNPSGYVIKFLRDKDGFPWDGFFSKLPTPIDVTTNKYMHVKVWKSRISPLKFKLEGGTGGTIEVVSMNPQTKINAWEDIVFNFSTKTGTYTTISFMPDFEDPLTLTEDITMYFDDIILNNNPAPLGPQQQVFNVNMTGSGITAGSKVWISGTFGGVNGIWAAPGTVPQNEMLDPNNDGIYSVTMNLPAGVVAFKFSWGPTGATQDPVAVGERSYNVTGNANLLFVWGTNGYTGSKDLSAASFKVFPNPVVNMLTIESPDLKGLRVLDLMGRTLKNYTFQAINSKQIDLSDLRSGIYFISVETAKGTFTSKIIKK